jgi:hypothetical protein
LHISGARITGFLDLCHVNVNRALLFEHCYFDEIVDLTGAHALWLSLRDCLAPEVKGHGLRIEGDLDLTGLTAARVNLFGAHIGGRLFLNSAKLHNPNGGFALNAPEVTIGSGMSCNGEFMAEGGVNLFGATIGSSLEFMGAMLTNATGYALRAPQLTLNSDLHLNGGFNSVGMIDLFGAQIRGQVWLNGAQLDHGEGGYALTAPLLSVGGGIYCRDGFKATGGINLFGATIGSTLELNCSILDSPTNYALRAPGLKVNADVTLNGGFTARGTIDLSRAVIHGVLDLNHASLTDSSIKLNGATVDTIRAASFGQSDHWQSSDLTYNSLEPYLPAKQRLQLLSGTLDVYHPQPYEELARYYRSLGHDEQARTVLLAKERHRRNRLSLPAKIWGYLQDGALGYGYRPARAALWLIVLIATLSTYFAAHPPRRSNPPKGPSFQPVIYAIDTLVPVFNLGQQTSYSATGMGQWVAWAAMLAGWILATAILAALTRALSRN